MLGKLFLSSLMITSMTCFGQVTTTGGYATTAVPAVPVSAANAPIIATPHIALPGSGPAPGAPLSNDNDSRVSSGPSVANPNVVAPVAAETTANPSGVSTAAPENVQAFEFGVQQFGSSSPNSGSRVSSLGEIARYYRAHHRQAVRTFNNDSIARLTTTGLPFEANSNVVASNSSPANVGGSSTASSGTTAQAPATLMAQNQQPALPQGDQESLPAPSNKGSTQTSATAAQQRHVPVHSPSTVQANPPAASNANPEVNSATAANKKATNLPQTGSSLPLLLLLGGAGLAGGTLWLLRR